MPCTKAARTTFGIRSKKTLNLPTEAEILLKEIQYKTGKTLEQIAEDVGYSRPYINNVKLKGGGRRLIDRLKSKYKRVLQDEPVRPPTVLDLIPPPDAKLVDLVKFERDLQKASGIINTRINKILQKAK